MGDTVRADLVSSFMKLKNVIDIFFVIRQMPSHVELSGFKAMSFHDRKSCAHIRLSTIINSDVIIVLDKGRIVAGDSAHA